MTNTKCVFWLEPEIIGYMRMQLRRLRDQEFESVKRVIDSGHSTGARLATIVLVHVGKSLMAAEDAQTTFVEVPNELG